MAGWAPSLRRRAMSLSPPRAEAGACRRYAFWEVESAKQKRRRSRTCENPAEQVPRQRASAVPTRTADQLIVFCLRCGGADLTAGRGSSKGTPAVTRRGGQSRVGRAGASLGVVEPGGKGG